MHKFLRAIGFSKIESRYQLEDIYKDILSSPNRKVASTINTGSTLVQFDKDFGNGIGISLIGEMDKSGSLSIEHFFPYVRPKVYTNTDTIDLEEHTYNKSYIGTIGDLFIAVMFYVQNIAECDRLLKYHNRSLTTVMLSALSTKGTIILPIEKYPEVEEKEKAVQAKKNKLMKNALEGDIDAINSITKMDINLYNETLTRIEEQSLDVLTVVDTTFLPTGVESDLYSIIGIIKEVYTRFNIVTNEQLYDITVESLGYTFNICINAEDLVGEPLPGRRFRGDIWLQGYIVI